MTVPRRPPVPSFRLLRYFAVASLAALLPVGATLLYFDRQEDELVKQVQREHNAFSAQMQDSFVQRHDAAAPAYLLQVYEAGNVNLTRLFANTLWETDFAPFVAKVQRIPVDQCRAIAEATDAGRKTVQPGEKKACYAGIGRQIMALPEFRALDAKVFNLVKKSTVLKIKVYDLRGITVYSSEHSQIGEDNLDSAGWKSAIAGKPASQLTSRGKFSAFEGEVANRDLISSYVPVLPAGSGRLVAVFEVYSDVTRFLGQIKSTSSMIRELTAANRAQMERAAAANHDKVDAAGKQMLAIVLGLLALFYFVLLLIVRNGQRIIDRQDVERRQAALALTRQKDLYDALSQSNKAIVHLVDRGELFAAVCRIAVEHGRFRFAWIGLIGESDSRLKPVARYGDDAGYIDALGASVDAEGASRRGLTGRTLLSGAYAISDDFLNDPAMAPWHAAARRAGVRASAKFPIREKGAVIGAISLYAGDPDFFTEELVATIDEIANDVSFALDNYAREAARERAEALYRQGEQRLDTVLQTSMDSFWIADTEGRILDVNDAYCRLIGYRREELLTMRIQDVEAMESPEDTARHIRKITAQRHDRFETRHRHKDGHLVDVEISVEFISDQDGERFFVFMHDISERKQAEAALREGEERYRQMFQANPHPMWVFDTETLGFLAVNDAAVVHYGWSREEFLAMTLADIRPAEGIPALREHLAADNEKKIRIVDNSRHRKKDGTPIDVEISSHLMDFGGRRARIVAAIDITERKRADEALRAATEQFRGLVEQSIAGTYIIQDGTFAYMNPRFAEIFGYGSADELVGRDPLSLVAEKDRGAVAENIRRRAEGEVQSVAYDFTAQRKDGTTVEVGVHGARATYRGRPAIIGLIQDISEKKRAEEQIRHYVAQLENAFMQSVEVATTLSEMRDPYTAGHERRVAEIAVAIGAELGFDARRQEGLRVAGYLHDIGKITVPAEILAKPAKLTPLEYELIKGHPQASHDVLKNVEFPWPVAEIARQHHERIDGSGYPQGLKGEAILLEARILAVADTVEAMSSHRPYRPGLGIDKALAEIERGRGTAYDPEVADACLKLFREKGYAVPA